MLERRVLLTALAATIALPAFAQTSQTQTPAASSNDAATPAAKGAQMGNMGAAEQKHVTDTMAAGAMSLVASRVAVKKASDEDVKEFAEFEVAEQETIADILMAMKDPSKASGKINKPSDTEARQHVAKDDLAALEKMEQMDGKKFDRAYIMAQIEGHQLLLRIQEDYLASGKDPAHLAVAKLARGQIKEHLQLLAWLRTGGGDDDKATTGRSSDSKK